MKAKSLLTGTLALCAAAALPALAQDKMYEGVTVNVFTFTASPSPSGTRTSISGSSPTAFYRRLS